MKIPASFMSNVEPPEVHDVVALFFGRGCRMGIVINKGKRKSQVRFRDGEVEWTDNRKLRTVHDKRVINEVRGAVANSFPEE